MLIFGLLPLQLWRMNSPARDCQQGQRPPCPPRRIFRAAGSGHVDTADSPHYIARQCPDGGIGRRTGFRYQRRKAWRFESSSGHHFQGKGRLTAAGQAAFPFLIPLFVRPSGFAWTQPPSTRRLASAPRARAFFRILPSEMVRPDRLTAVTQGPVKPYLYCQCFLRPTQVRRHQPQVADRDVAERALLRGGWGDLNIRDKWIFRVMAACCCERGEDHGKMTTPESQPGIQGEGGGSRDQGREDRDRAGPGVRRPSEPDQAVARSAA